MFPPSGPLTTGMGLMLSSDPTVPGWLTDFESPEAPQWSAFPLFKQGRTGREKEGQTRSMGLTNQDAANRYATRIYCIVQGATFNIL